MGSREFQRAELNELSPALRAEVESRATGGNTPRGVLVEVWKDASCGCCKEWIKHVESHGFRVAVHDVGKISLRAIAGPGPDALRERGSCELRNGTPWQDQWLEGPTPVTLEAGDGSVVLHVAPLSAE